MRGYRSRVLLGAVAGSLLAVVIVVIVVVATLETLSLRTVDVSPELHTACEASPQSYVGLSVGRGSVTAFDSAGRSPDGAQSLAPELVGALEVGEQAPRREGGRPHLIRRLSAEGPCAYVSIDIGPPPLMKEIVPLMLGLAALLITLMAAVGSYWFTVRPLTRRILRVRDAAQRVGQPDYAPMSQALNDDLGDISRVLDHSHERLVADREELVARHHALERHLAEIAHDLRTPIWSLMLQLEAQLVVSDGEPTPLHNAFLDAEYLGSLVENLHQAVRLRHGMNPAEGVCDLTEIVQRLEGRFRPLGKAEGVEVATSYPETPVHVQCSPEFVERALGNFVHNAITHARGRVAVWLRVEGETFEVRVLDDGVGLPDVARADLAKRTFTDDPARSRGAGLGIAIANEIAARVGWMIHYEAVREGGLQVRIEGPRSGNLPRS
ncbi:MAG: ATP-binding protein [Bradymonadia bacterium]